MQNLQQSTGMVCNNGDENNEDEPQFGLPEYWDERYKKNSDPYDWFINWTDVVKSMNAFFNDHQKFDRALNLGCGNSPMFLQIKKYFNDVYNIDISNIVIKQLKEKYQNDQNQHFQQMDCSKLDFPDMFFDVVFDKATLDAIECGEDSRSILIESIIQLFRVLKINGLFVEITCGFIMPYIQKGTQFRGKRLHWELIHSEKLLSPIREGQIVYVYIFRKLSNDYDENGCDDDDFIHKDDDDFLLQLCNNSIDMELI